MYRLCSQSATATARRRSATSTRRWRTCRSAWTSTASGEGAESASGVGTTRRGSTARAVLPGSSGRLRCATCHPYVAFHHRSLNVTHLSFLCVCVCVRLLFFHLTRCGLTTRTPASRARATRAAPSARLACRIPARQLPVRTKKKKSITKLKINSSLFVFLLVSQLVKLSEPFHL